MTLTITLTAQIGSASGVNFNADYSSYFSNLVPTGWPYILGGSGQFAGDEIVLLDKIVAGKEEQTKSIILDGEDFNYYFNDHTLSGRLTTVRLATLGDSYNSADGSFDQDGSGHITNVSTSIEISGLDIYNAYGEKGELHEVIYGLMGGAHDGGGKSNPTELSQFLWAEGHNVIGSTGGDTYAGSKFADTVRGNGGNDVLDGKEGTDTAVFSGKKSDYTVTRNADGSVTVQDKRTAKDGKDTLKNIEIAKFSDGTIDLTKLASTNKAPTSLALSKSAIAENSAVNTAVGIFSATDLEGKALTYTLTDTAGGLFKLSGNKLLVAKAIDYEKLQSDTVTLQVRDADGGVATKVFTITISDVLEAIKGTTASETLKGGIGADKIAADAGNDVVYGYAGNDQIDGGTGNDTLNGGVGADKLVGGVGTDTASYAGATKAVVASLTNAAANTNDAKGDTYSSIENLTGTSYNDSLTGDSGANTLYGAAGNDTLDGSVGNDVLVGGAGADKLIGGAGTDTASYVDAARGVAANLANAALTSNDAKGDTYSSIENLTGSRHNDILTGNSGANTVYGGAGDDRIYGGLGNDLLIGGSGKDTFVFDTKLGSTNIDTIDDFIAKDDTIRLDDDIFTSVGKVGVLTADAFYAGTKAHDVTDRVIYDSTTGKLWYDADGSGKGAAIQFAILDKGLVLTAADFDIIA